MSLQVNDSNKRPNRLIREKSPYLLQHAYNPVDWWPWCDEAFETARREDKPIFLSIGYSTCHWCHVMEKESFEDHEIAKLMNETFINIKVDREERPDIDHLYMSVALVVNGHGGWPLTIMMTPDKKPFFVATYIPREGYFGNAGMVDIIPRIRQLWLEDRKTLLQAADNILQHLVTTLINTPSGTSLRENDLDEAFSAFSEVFDEEHGSFGKAPKFPSPHTLMFLLRYWYRTGNSRALYMVEKTLREMRMGGIFDHVGFGFHRYSTDRRWMVPHFEKMLYDQALLVMAYVEAYQATKNEMHARAAREVLTYVLRDLASPEGAFYSAEDADSEGIEGKFYVWTEKEIRTVLSEKEAEILIKVFNVKEEGNYQDEATGPRTGGNILYQKNSLNEIAVDLGMTLDELMSTIESARSKLFKVRKQRVHPFKDDKILTDWNGLMIAALAKAGRILDEEKYIKAAEQCADFILTKMFDSKGRLLHRYKDDEAEILGFLDDHIFLTWGLLELYETTFNVFYLKKALDLTNHLLEHFWDEESGGFYFTADYCGDDLVVRKKEFFDGAIPAGNSVAMYNLLRISHVTGNDNLKTLVNIIGRAISPLLRRSPSSFSFALAALEFVFGSPSEVVIVGACQDPWTREMIKMLDATFIPNKIVLLKPIDDEKSVEVLNEVAPFVKNMQLRDGLPTVYVCRNHHCNLPTTSVSQMMKLLEAGKD